jgi:hypothetical protein
MSNKIKGIICAAAAATGLYNLVGLANAGPWYRWETTPWLDVWFLFPGAEWPGRFDEAVAALGLCGEFTVLLACAWGYWKLCEKFPLIERPRESVVGFGVSLFAMRFLPPVLTTMHRYPQAVKGAMFWIMVMTGLRLAECLGVGALIVYFGRRFGMRGVPVETADEKMPEHQLTPGNAA